jgi:hypothetical protein
MLLLVGGSWRLCLCHVVAPMTSIRQRRDTHGAYGSVMALFTPADPAGCWCLQLQRHATLVEVVQLHQPPQVCVLGVCGSPHSIFGRTQQSPLGVHPQACRLPCTDGGASLASKSCSVTLSHAQQLCDLCNCRYSWTALMINQFEGNDPVWLEGKTVLVRAPLLQRACSFNYVGGLALLCTVVISCMHSAV